jgi:hypothetical protein
VLFHSVVLPSALTSPGARHCDLHAAEGPKQRSRAVALPVAGNTTGAIGILRIRLWTTAVARAGKRRLELGLDHRLDELAHPITQTADYATFNSNQTPNGVVRRPQKSKSTSRYPIPGWVV